VKAVLGPIGQRPQLWWRNYMSGNEKVFWHVDIKVVTAQWGCLTIVEWYWRRIIEGRLKDILTLGYLNNSPIAQLEYNLRAWTSYIDYINALGK
jgi:hypothetical protein